jgi:hypothetical protein
MICNSLTTFFSFYSSPFTFSRYVPFQMLYKITPSIFTYRGRRWRKWLTHCATNQKVVCLISDVIIILLAGSASNRNEYLEYFQVAAVAYGPQNYHLHMSAVTKSGSHTSWNNQGLSRPGGKGVRCVECSKSKIYVSGNVRKKNNI